MAFFLYSGSLALFRKWNNILGHHICSWIFISKRLVLVQAKMFHLSSGSTVPPNTRHVTENPHLWRRYCWSDSCLLAYPGQTYSAVVERFSSLRASSAQIDLRRQAVEVVKRTGLLEAVRTKLVDELGVSFGLCRQCRGHHNGQLLAPEREL